MRKINSYRVLPIILFALLLSTSCSQKPKIIIEGELSNLDKPTQVLLQIEEFNGSKVFGKADVTPKKGHFKFSLKEIAEPTLASLVVGDKQANKILLLAEPNEKLRLVIDSKAISKYSVEGSVGSQQVQLLSARLQRTRHALDSLNKLILKTSEIAAKQRLQEQYVAAIDSQRAFNSRFIWANPMSRASVVALYQQYAPNIYVFDRPEDLHLFRMVATSIIAMYPNSSYATGMRQDVAEMARKVKDYQVLNFLKQAEASLPEIALPNAQGDIIKLSSLKGKVIIVNFWAADNQTSLIENRELSNIYNSFKGKPLVLFNVSVDVDKQVWLRAIETTGMPGIHVGEIDPKNPIAAASYNVTEIPTNFVIDKNYDIIGRNVRGDALKRMIEELL